MVGVWMGMGMGRGWWKVPGDDGGLDGFDRVNEGN